MNAETVMASRWFAGGASEAPLVAGARLVRLHHVFEPRGRLTVGDVGAGLPFVPRRFFVISRVPDTHIRGEHAHRALEQLLVCLAGSVIAEVDDGRQQRAVLLDCPQVGLYLAPMVWGVQHDYSSDAVLLVLASREYDPSDYIREYAQFVQLRGAR